MCPKSWEGLEKWLLHLILVVDSPVNKSHCRTASVFPLPALTVYWLWRGFYTTLFNSLGRPYQIVLLFQAEDASNTVWLKINNYSLLFTGTYHFNRNLALSGSMNWNSSDIHVWQWWTKPKSPITRLVGFGFTQQQWLQHSASYFGLHIIFTH